MGTSLSCPAFSQGAATQSTGSTKSLGSQAMPERCRMSGVSRPPAARTTTSAAKVRRRAPDVAATPTARPFSMITSRTRQLVTSRAPFATAARRNSRLSHFAPDGQPRTQRPQFPHVSRRRILGRGRGASPMSSKIEKRRDVVSFQRCRCAVETGTSRSSSENSASRSTPIALNSWSRRRAFPVATVVVPPVPMPQTRTIPPRVFRILRAGKSRRIWRSSKRRPRRLSPSGTARLVVNGRNSRPASRTRTSKLPWSSLAAAAPPAPVPTTTAVFTKPPRGTRIRPGSSPSPRSVAR
jgi:hypothetical protein